MIMKDTIFSGKKKTVPLNTYMFAESLVEIFNSKSIALEV
jgi:hypothetical protein